jgi:endonuclease-3 related protein
VSLVAPHQTGRLLKRFYRALFDAYGPQGWWPGRTPTEVVVGAVLTQNTNWLNVEKAIVNLRRARLLSWQALREVSPAKLAELIRPAGYFNVKARRLKNLVDWLWSRHAGKLSRLRKAPMAQSREELLSVNGVGPETADSILLYALDHPSFVVDAYTKRVLRRHGVVGSNAGYDDVKGLFELHLPRDVRLFNEYHALIVAVAKKHCRSTAKCKGCPLELFEHDAAR